MNNFLLFIALLFLCNISCTLPTNDDINDGLEWIETSKFDGGDITDFLIKDSLLFAGTRKGVFYTKDMGSSWIESNNGIPQNASIRCLCFYDDTIYAGTYNNGIYKSYNNGTNWINSSNGLPDSSNIRELVFINDLFFAGSRKGVFLSTDYGFSWKSANSGLTDTHINALAVKGTDIFALCCGGPPHDGILFHSSNNGASWIRKDSGIASMYGTDLLVKGQDIFAGTDGAGIFHSNNNGISWTTKNIGLPDAYIRSFVSKDSTLFVATNSEGPSGGGIYMSNDTGNNWSHISKNHELTYGDVRTIIVFNDFLFAGTATKGIWYLDIKNLLI